jgi:hypothetical protein
MLACHAPYVCVEEIDSGQRGTQTVTSDPLRTLLETWVTANYNGSCMRPTPLLCGHNSADICAATLQPYG